MFLVIVVRSGKINQLNFLTFSCEESLRGVTPTAVAGSAGVAAAVLLLHPLDGQSLVVVTQNHTWEHSS